MTEPGGWKPSDEGATTFAAELARGNMHVLRVDMHRVELTTSVPGSHELRTDNFPLDAVPAVMTDSIRRWTGRRVDPDAPWTVVVMQRGNFANRREILAR